MNKRFIMIWNPIQSLCVKNAEIFQDLTIHKLFREGIQSSKKHSYVRVYICIRKGFAFMLFYVHIPATALKAENSALKVTYFYVSVMQ